jgi:threonine/homoserine/homoserine lactone efflux protein
MKDRCLRTSSLIFRVHLNYCQNSKTLMHIIEQLASQRETLNFSIENFNRCIYNPYAAAYVLSVLLRFTDPDYPFGIFKLSLLKYTMIYTVNTLAIYC